MTPEQITRLGIKEVLFEFSIAYIGWECDTVGWIVLFENGLKGVVMTDHGTPKVVSAAELQLQINLYQNLIEETKQAMELMKGEEE